MLRVRCGLVDADEPSFVDHESRERRVEDEVRAVHPRALRPPVAPFTEPVRRDHGARAPPLLRGHHSTSIAGAAPFAGAADLTFASCASNASSFAIAAGDAAMARRVSSVTDFPGREPSVP